MANEIQKVLDDMVANFKRILDSNLVGVYLHGSLSMNCYNPISSDIDILVIVKDVISHATKVRLVEMLISIESENPSQSIEMSLMRKDELINGHHPFHFLLHYSKLHRVNYESNGTLCEDSHDYDLAAHLAMTKSRGRCLCGEDIERLEIFIKTEDFLDSVLRDLVYDEEEIKLKPCYFILNLCRTLKFLEDHTFSSKREGGQWALGKYGAEYDDVIDRMLCQYMQNAPNEVRYLEDNKYIAKALLKKVQACLLMP
jgi:streptomycin 3"-adenylyltransferase